MQSLQGLFGLVARAQQADRMRRIGVLMGGLRRKQS
jgi:hypothetical protein